MKIKSLLLGSAAAMIAVSGAQAADAIIVEPEPMEYVKVCDMYGAGFFYIPGTETCMNINGYVRSTYAHTERNASSIGGGAFIFTTDTTSASVTTGFSGKNESSWNYRGRLNFDVRNETEYGTLRSQLRLQGGDSEGGADANVGIDRALISLAGFRLGYSDTYWTTNHGYGAGSPAINDGFYNYDQAVFFDYTATLMDGVSVTVGVQDSNGGAFGASSPDLYAGLNATFGGLTVAGTVIRDNGALEVNGGAFTPTDDSWAWKVSAIMDLGQSGWQVGGWYMASDSPFNQYVSGNGGFWGGYANYGGGFATNTGPNGIGTDSQWGVQVIGSLTSNLSAYGLYTEAEGDISDSDTIFGAGSLAGYDVKTEAWAVGVVWAPVSNLTVQVEYADADSTVKLNNGNGHKMDTNGYYVRVTRSF